MGPRSTSRSTDAGAEGDGALVVGLVRGPHGARGEVRIDRRTDVADRFRPGAPLHCDGVGPLVVASSRGDPAEPIVRFHGYDDRAAATALRGRFLRVTRAESRRASAGAYLWADLVGLRAETPDGTTLGTVREVLRAGEADVLVVREGGEERLLPLLASVVHEVDLAGGRVVVVPQEELEGR
ncbi:MAG: ribosome maturation factor RimM [Candidatus Limnocylindria bacterium]